MSRALRGFLWVGLCLIVAGRTVKAGEEGSLVHCMVDGNIVVLEWEVPDDIVALGFAISRNGELVKTLGPDARRYTREVPAGEHTFVVSTNNRLGEEGEAPDFLIGTCTVKVGGEEPGIECVVDGAVIRIHWEPLAPDAGSPELHHILVLRGEQVVGELPPEATQYEGELPVGHFTYTVVAVYLLTGPGGVEGTQDVIGSCKVFRGEAAGVTCRVDGRLVIVSWEPLAITVAIEGYRVRRNGELVGSVGPDTTVFKDDPPPGAYHYKVSAVMLSGEEPGVPAEGDEIAVGGCEVVVEGDGGLAPPTSLECAVAESAPVQVQLFWKNPVSYGAIVVERDGHEIAVLEGEATRHSDVGPGPGRHVYAVYGRREEQRSEATTCVVELDGSLEQNRLSFEPFPPPPGAAAPALALSPTVYVLLENADPIQAWSFGICSDPSVATVALATVDGTATADLNEGAGPAFLNIEVLDSGVTMGVVIDDLDPSDVLPPGGAKQIFMVGYEQGVEAEYDVAYPVSFCGELGDPPVAVVVVIEGQSEVPGTAPGAIMFTRGAHTFLRGDPDNDGEMTMTDGIVVLEWLFRSGLEPGCIEAADPNGSREVDIADPVYMFQALFTGGPQPLPPYPDCEVAQMYLGCEESGCDD